MEGLLIAVFSLLGAAVGSFLNVCIDRLPDNKSIVYPPSRCAVCQKRLSARDLIPVLSYLWLRGRCRHCKTAIPRRILWVEISGAAMFPLLYCYYGLSAEMAVAVYYFCLFLVIFVIDLEHHLILNKIVYPGAVIAVIFSIFLSGIEVVPGIASAAAGGGIGLGVFLLIVLLSRGGMGWGDVKMAALIGLVLGYPLVFVALLLAVISGGLVATVLLISKTKGRKQSIAFGPFLSLGTIVTLLWGTNILDWYLGFF